jgi:methyltransferase
MTILFAAVMAVLLVERGIEVILAKRNRRWILKRGGKEFGGWHYPLIVGMHILFGCSLVWEWSTGPRTPSKFWPIGLIVLVLAQLARGWAMASLGRFWNTRIIVLPGFEPISKGPYRFVRHPNYVVVAMEILVLPLMFRAWITAGVFTLLNTVLLGIRIREEEAALTWAAGGGIKTPPRFIPHFFRSGAASGVDGTVRSE